jgi:hypothetical protein
MKRAVLVIVLAACACSSSVPAAVTSPVASTSAAQATSAASPTPAVSAAGARYAIIAGTDGTLRLIGLDGGAVATVDLNLNWYRPNMTMPFTSASSTRLYYLDDNGAAVHYVQADGATGLATTIKLQQNQVAGFAVSPDNARIAVSVFSFTAAPPGGFPDYLGMRLYVEDLAGGAHHVDIFSSTTVFEFPIAWVGGRLVMAQSAPLCCPSPLPNPYGATEYHVVNPDTGLRLVTVCGNGLSPRGPIEPIGVICWAGTGQPRFETWAGSDFPPPTALETIGPPYHVALSPDGTHVALGGHPILISSNGSDYRLNVNGDALGWFDATHVVVSEDGGENGWLLDSRTSAGVQITGVAAYYGALPTAIS